MNSVRMTVCVFAFICGAARGQEYTPGSIAGLQPMVPVVRQPAPVPNQVPAAWMQYGYREEFKQTHDVYPLYPGMGGNFNSVQFQPQYNVAQPQYQMPAYSPNYYTQPVAQPYMPPQQYYYCRPQQFQWYCPTTW